MKVKIWFPIRYTKTGITNAIFDDMNCKISKVIVDFPCMPKKNIRVNIMSFIDDYNFNEEDKKTFIELFEKMNLKVWSRVVHKDFVEVNLVAC